MRALGNRSIASFVKFVLNIAWWAVAAALGLLVILFACSLVIELRGDNLTLSLPVAVQLEAPIHALSVGTAAQLEKLQGNLRFPVRKGAFFSGTIAVVGIGFGYLLWVVTQLRYVFRSLSLSQPFAAENARRIRRVGFAVIYGEIGRAVIVYLWSDYASRHFTADGLRFVAAADIHGITIVGGLVILVIAEVFREGVRLHEDQSLTI